MMPQALSRSMVAAILSGVLHGGAFWAASFLESEPSQRVDRYPPMELVSMVEVEKAEPPSLAVASEPGVEPESEDAPQEEAPKEVSPASEKAEPPPPVEPPPKAAPPAAKAPTEEPPSETLEELPPDAISPTANQRALPTTFALKPFIPQAGLIRVPQGRPSKRRARATVSNSARGQRSSGRAKGGKKGNLNPVLLTALDRELRRTYPNDAREAGIEGYAKLDLVVTRWGRPESIRIVSSHGHPAFGEACLRAVKRSRWRPAKDQSGRRIAMRVRYRCRFTVDL